MASCEIRTEPGKVTIELFPPIGRGAASLYLLSFLVLVTELYTTFPYRAGVVRTTPNPGRGGTGDWFLWIAFTLVCLVVFAVQVPPLWQRALMGRELSRFTHDAVICDREPLVGWPYTDRYEMYAITRPYFEPREGITFGYPGATASIGTGMTRFEARNAIDAVLREFPETASIWAHCTDKPQEKSHFPSIIAK